MDKDKTDCDDMPERIWLIPNAGNDGETVWCDDPAPGADMDPDDAVEYRRADLCASGQVRALEWEQVDPTAVLGHGIEPCQYYIRYEVGSWWMPGDAEVEDAQEFDDLEAAKAALEAYGREKVQEGMRMAAEIIRGCCPECLGTGVRDSGGVHPWGEPISVPCDCTDAILAGMETIV